MKDALNIIHSYKRLPKEAGLHRMRALCDAIGNPQDNLKFVHVAGTNGKGSTSTMIASVLENSGYKTGLYTSPYLLKFNERIKINGEMIDDNSLFEITNIIYDEQRKLELKYGEQISEFEFITAVAFLYFYQKKCDIVVLETGLGGLYDATNIIKSPEICVITPISLDHTQILGDTIEKITQSKAGIIKNGCKTIVASGQDERALNILKKYDIKIANPVQNKKCDLNGSKFDFMGKIYEISMIGEHQIQNAQTALQAIFELKNLGWNIINICEGLKKANIEGRMEKISDNPLILLDGGHNKEGVKTILKAANTILKDKEIVIIVGISSDKDIKSITHILSKMSDNIFITMPQNERALDCEILFNYFNSRKIKGIYKNSFDAFNDAIIKNNGQAIIICGSLYLVGEAKSFFKDLHNFAKN